MHCARQLEALISDEAGQATVEAAFALPILCLLILLLIQPGILLYDRMVMQAAAAEGCRLLTTASADYGSVSDSCDAFVRHRLASIPPLACFHVHEGDCSWVITPSGDETAQTVSVSITNEVQPLPLLGSAASLIGAVNDNGNLEIKVSVSMPTQPGWVSSATSGDSPSSWVGAWL